MIVGLLGLEIMGAAKMSVKGWAEIRAASEAGVDDVTLSKDFGISREAIRKYRSRDNKKGDPWITPKHLQTAAMVEKLKLKMKNSNHTTLEPTMTAEESLAQRLLRDGESASSHAMKVLLKKLTAAALDPDSIADLEDVGDVSTAVKAARSIAGLDKPDTQVAISVSNLFPSE